MTTKTIHLEIAVPSWACLDEEKIIPVITTTTDATASEARCSQHEVTKLTIRPYNVAVVQVRAISM